MLRVVSPLTEMTVDSAIRAKPSRSAGQCKKKTCDCFSEFMANSVDSGEHIAVFASSP